jgi:protein SCO1
MGFQPMLEPPARAGCPWYGIALLLILATTATAQTSPNVLDKVGIDEKLNTQLPLDLHFRDETGRDVMLNEYFGKRPVILTLVYYKCPMLCTLVLNDLLRAMNVMKASAGENFDVVTVSFDPRETPDLAAAKKREYSRNYRRGTAEKGWHFLTGDEFAIKELTSAVGFRYAYDPKFQQYAHASGIIILTPTGKTSRYFFGLDYSAKDLGNAIADASSGAISTTPAPRVLLYCFHYDPTTGKYSLIVTRAMRVLAVMVLIAIAAFILVMIRRDYSRTPGAQT